MDEFKKDDSKMKFYTGLTFCQFMVLFRFLGSTVNNLIYWGRERKHVEDTPTKRRGPKGRTIRYPGGGGGAESFCWLQTFFLPPQEDNHFFQR